LDVRRLVAIRDLAVLALEEPVAKAVVTLSNCLVELCDILVATESIQQTSTLNNERLPPLQSLPETQVTRTNALIEQVLEIANNNGNALTTLAATKAITNNTNTWADNDLRPPVAQVMEERIAGEFKVALERHSCPNCGCLIDRIDLVARNWSTWGRILYESQCVACHHKVFAIRCDFLDRTTWRSLGFVHPALANASMKCDSTLAPIEETSMVKIDYKTMERQEEMRARSSTATFMEDLPRRKTPTLSQRLTYGFHLLQCAGWR